MQNALLMSPNPPVVYAPGFCIIRTHKKCMHSTIAIQSIPGGELLSIHPLPCRCPSVRGASPQSWRGISGWHLGKGAIRSPCGNACIAGNYETRCDFGRGM